MLQESNFPGDVSAQKYAPLPRWQDVPANEEAPWLCRFVEQCRSGHREAEEHLWDILRSDVQSMIVRMTPECVDDVMQETALESLLYLRSKTIEKPGVLVHVLRQIANAVACGVIRRKQRMRCYPILHDRSVRYTDGAVPADVALIRQERLDAAMRQRQRLTPQEKEVLDRFYDREQNREQICREMGLTESQFRNCKSRAKEKLKPNPASRRRQAKTKAVAASA